LLTIEKTTPKWQGIAYVIGIQSTPEIQCEAVPGQTLFTENFQQTDLLTTHLKYISTAVHQNKKLDRRILSFKADIYQ